MNRILSPNARVSLTCTSFDANTTLPNIKTNLKVFKDVKTKRKPRSECLKLSVSAQKAMLDRYLAKKGCKAVRRRSIVDSRSGKSDSTKPSDLEDQTPNGSKLTHKEEQRWVSIHQTMIDDIRDKVNHAKKLRFMGLCSPNRLNQKANKLVLKKRYSRHVFSNDRASEFEDSTNSFEDNPTVNLRKLMPEDTSAFKIGRNRGSMVDTQKHKVNQVLTMPSMRA